MSLGYEQVAVAALVTALEDETTGLVAQLRIVEIEDGLSSGALTDPAEIVAAFLPSDTRSPLVQVYDEASEPLEAGHRNSIAAVDCTIGLTYNSDADLVAAELFIRRYVRAIRMVLAADPLLGGTARGARWARSNRALPMDYDSTTRHGRAIGVTVHVHDP